MITFQEERLEDCLDECIPLLEKHWAEVYEYRDISVLDPDYQKYYDLEANGSLHVVTARDDGVIVGYYSSFLSPSIHCPKDLLAVNDVLYVSHGYRNKDTGYQLFEFAEECLKDLGVSIMIMCTKTEFPFDLLCESRGFKNTERVFSKHLGGL